MRRREFLSGAVGGAAALGAIQPVESLAEAPAAATTMARPAVFYVPGYRPDLAHYRGRPVPEAPEFRRQLPANYAGETTLIARIDEASGSVRRALLPIRGHAVTLNPVGGPAFWNSMDRATQLTFDPTTLELVALRSLGEDFVGGGHALALPDGKHILVTERRRYAGWQGDAARHEGRLAIRDAENLRLIEAFGCGGMSPHDVALMPDGRHVAVANYGSLLAPDGWRPEIRAPSVSVIELASGRLVESFRPEEPAAEVRHLAAGRGGLLALLVRRGSVAERDAFLRSVMEVYEPDDSSFDDGSYLPAPIWNPADGGGQALLWPGDPLDARQGQTLVYDPAADEFIASFATSHRILVIDGAGERITRTIETDRLGLRQPRGIQLHPDDKHYAVSGSWADILLFERRNHRPVPERRIGVSLFHHSHMTIG
jgi:DNA-binding beta-propeller fold protein YncE